jgi:penicillin-binding protein 2
MKDNAWFVGYAPRSAPEIVVAALFEHGEHGHFAAPIVRDVIKVYFDKKARLSAHSAPPKPAKTPEVGFVRPENPPPRAEPITTGNPSPTPF